jgi:FKBP-type peptidyl-prolyl cis-trans isomerase
MLRDAFARGSGGFAAASAIVVGTWSFPRHARALVEGGGKPSRRALGEEYRQGTAALGDSLEAESLPREAYKKLPSGVIYADISVGGGNVSGNANDDDDGLVREGSRVNVQWVLRRSNGYFVDSSAVSDSVPFIFTVGDPKGAIKGLDEGIRGMRAGGTRRILVPPVLAYVEGIDDGRPGPIPAGFGPRQQMRRVMEVRRDVPGEYIFLEVKVTKVR